MCKMAKQRDGRRGGVKASDLNQNSTHLRQWMGSNRSTSRLWPRGKTPMETGEF